MPRRGSGGAERTFSVQGVTTERDTAKPANTGEKQKRLACSRSRSLDKQCTSQADTYVMQQPGSVRSMHWPYPNPPQYKQIIHSSCHLSTHLANLQIILPQTLVSSPSPAYWPESGIPGQNSMRHHMSSTKTRCIHERVVVSTTT